MCGHKQTNEDINNIFYFAFFWIGLFDSYFFPVFWYICACVLIVFLQLSLLVTTPGKYFCWLHFSHCSNLSRSFLSPSVQLLFGHTLVQYHSRTFLYRIKFSRMQFSRCELPRHQICSNSTPGPLVVLYCTLCLQVSSVVPTRPSSSKILGHWLFQVT